VNYWDRVLRRRLSRRAALSASAAGTGVLALSLAGCGGGSDDGGEATTDATGLISKPVDTTSKAKPGGILERMIAQDTSSFDPLRVDSSAVAGHANYAYSRLAKFTRVKYPNRPDGGVEGDAATGWETSGDGLTTTIKLRPNMKMDPRPPTNSRNLTSADVLYSWTAYSTFNAERDVLANAVDPGAPIIRMETPDANTIVVKTAFPYGPLMNMLAFRRYVNIMPVEAENNGFNVKETMRGSGGFRLKSYQPSVGFEYEKNPDWYNAKDMLINGVKITIIPEYATGLSQFRAGNLWEFGVRAEDILSTKRDLPKLLMRAQDVFSRGTGYHFRFGGLPQSVFRDERLRQAVSMLMDRDLYIDVFGNVEQFTKEGLAVDTRWNSAFYCGEEAFWLDPKPDNSKLGEAAKFYKHNPAEAKKLVRAAGFTGPVVTDYEWTINNYGNEYQRTAEVIRGMLEANGDFKFNPVAVDYQTVHVPKYHTSGGQFDGMMVGSQGARAEIDGWLSNAGKGGTTKSYTGEPDAVLDGMIDKQRRELDRNKRVTMLHDIQKYIGLHMKFIVNPGQALGFNLYQPWYGNTGTYVYYDGGGEIPQDSLVSIWYDEAQRTA
jgi:ABC-type transport system substrate-binding protein